MTQVAIKEWGNKFLSAKPSREVVFAEKPEGVKPFLRSNGHYALQFQSGKYLSVGPASDEVKKTGNGGVYAVANSIGEMELFEVVEL